MSVSMSPVEAWAHIELPQLLKQTRLSISLNDRHNRRVRLQALSQIIKSFTKVNDLGTKHCGLIKAPVNGKNYYFGVRQGCDGSIDIVPLKTFPTGALEGFLEFYWTQVNDKAVGVMIGNRRKLLPILIVNDELTIGSWK